MMNIIADDTLKVTANNDLETMVKVSLQKYNDFISLEARACAVVEYISRSDYPKAEEILGIIGTDYALQVADKISANKLKSEVSS